MLRRVTASLGLMLALASGASAQSGTSATSTAQSQSGAQQSASASTTTDLRPATTTFYGDTGLWFVPTAEVLAHGKWSVSGYRRGTDYIQGFTNVGDFAGTFAVGLGNRAEIFGSFLFDTRIDRDLRPLFTSDPKVGGIIDRYPNVNTSWTGNNVGDLYIGGKYNLMSQADNKAAAMAVRAIVKLPTGKSDVGVTTGKTDFAGDFIVSSELQKMIELSGFAGYEWRGQPDGFDTPTGAFRWGAGGAFPSRSPLRGMLELNGYVPNKSVATIGTSGPTPLIASPVVGTDGSVPPISSDIQNLTRLSATLTYQAKSGLFVGLGVSWSLPRQSRTGYGGEPSDPFSDYIDWQVRIGYHPGVRVYTPPPPPAPAPTPAPTPAPPPNRPPTVTASCNPSTVQVGGTCTLTAVGNDPDGDPLTYRWTVPSGALANPTDRVTVWTAPQQEGPVVATVTVSDGKGGTASANTTIQVIRPPVRNYTFEDVHFDFDRYTLRPEATRLLDEAVAALRDDPNLRIQIEGHTCNIGTAEYNLALGDRRANAVRDYLVSRGVAADRLQTISYGEERPKYDNSREETRRLNRRAALTVNVTR
jgi:peptidoglycan-associated lipoprotein